MRFLTLPNITRITTITASTTERKSRPRTSRKHWENKARLAKRKLVDELLRGCPRLEKVMFQDCSEAALILRGADGAVTGTRWVDGSVE